MKKSKELIITKQPKKEKGESKIKRVYSKIINIIKKRWLVKGFTTLLLVAIILGIYVGINILLDNVVLPELDTTENKVYSLSEETKTKVKDLEKEVKITLINYTETETVTGFAEKYTALNNKVKLEKIDDLSSRKDIMDEYALDTSSQLIIIASGESETTLGELNGTLKPTENPEYHLMGRYVFDNTSPDVEFNLTEGEITSRATSRYTIITICRYASYI